MLLIACANIANLADGARLRPRAGSSRSGPRSARPADALIRQLLTESLLLAALGGLAGLAVGVWAVDALVAIAPAGAPRLDEVRVDPTVFLFAAAADASSTGVLFGLVPALQASRDDVAQPLKDGGARQRGGGGPRRAARADRRRSGAGADAAHRRRAAAPDLRHAAARRTSASIRDSVLVGVVNPPRAGGYDTTAKHRAFYDQVLERARALPGVRQAALASVLPLSGDSDTQLRDRRPAGAASARRRHR